MKKTFFLLLAVSMFNVYSDEDDQSKEEKRVRLTYYSPEPRFPGRVCREYHDNDGKSHKFCVDEY